ncbi:hypothetical protein PV325_002089 [Microctonus aethiopoides]|uniref:Uncharacterized protein n=1 Tax=Microctonus aethiopoides TaxID=144406 RepID=A0AA39KTD2_9HYME|nr:hypothetical protein PV325_002089 [Microctonus aethiopoides]KAK0097972.1 hypothetical protein PV326_012095 [Microctonus aethiopoides]KAK0173022.1 hypothetical protein PV328_006277 [Microctonus aethiopoides]
MPMTFEHSARTSIDYDQCPKYENSYRLESYRPFRPDPVDEIIKTMMNNRLEDIIYDAATAPSLCSEIAADIRKKIMKLQFDRYKIVVVVTIIEKASQSLRTNLGFLWDDEKDNYSIYSFETQTFFAYCYVIGAYYE